MERAGSRCWNQNHRAGGRLNQDSRNLLEPGAGGGRWNVVLPCWSDGALLGFKNLNYRSLLKP